MGAIYLDYDQKALDVQYDLRGAVKDAEQCINRYTEWSSQVRDEYSCEMDIAYGTADGEKLNLFRSERENSPVHVFIHGGYWQRLDKNDFDFVAKGILPSGAHFLSINYDLAPKVSMDEIVRQARSSIEWVWRNAECFGGNRNQIYVSGHSAGGHLASMLMQTEWSKFATDLPIDVIKGGCTISGIYDLEPVRLCHQNEGLHLDEPAVFRNSPLLHLSENMAPLILSVGGNETADFQRQQRAFVQQIKERGLPHSVVEMPGFHHFDVIFELANPDSPLTRAIYGQMGCIVG